jgi:hypothetical protein
VIGLRKFGNMKSRFHHIAKNAVYEAFSLSIVESYVQVDTFVVIQVSLAYKVGPCFAAFKISAVLGLE